jgi:hypothetical protein
MCCRVGSQTPRAWSPIKAGRPSCRNELMCIRRANPIAGVPWGCEPWDFAGCGAARQGRLPPPAGSPMSILWPAMRRTTVAT